jgi:Mrp family chromosome partitioning ATPase
MAVARLRSSEARDPAVLGFASWMSHPSTGSRTVIFMAARRREGTSSVALEFARAARDLGRLRVLLLDATPRVILREQPRRALLDTVRDQLVLELAIARCDEEVDRAVLADPATRRPMFDEAFGANDLWCRLREHYDTVVVDAPALEESHLGLVLARGSDAVVVVVQAERTRRPAVLRLIDLLRQSGAPLAGTVLNQHRHYVPRFIYDRL